MGIIWCAAPRATATHAYWTPRCGIGVPAQCSSTMRTTMSVSRAQAAAAPRPAHCPAARCDRVLRHTRSSPAPVAAVRLSIKSFAPLSHRPGRTSRRIVVAPRAEAAKPGALHRLHRRWESVWFVARHHCPYSCANLYICLESALMPIRCGVPCTKALYAAVAPLRRRNSTCRWPGRPAWYHYAHTGHAVNTCRGSAAQGPQGCEHGALNTSASPACTDQWQW